MPSAELFAGALSLQPIHNQTGCPHSALNAARQFERNCEQDDLDGETHQLCERASERLSQTQTHEERHACPA